MEMLEERRMLAGAHDPEMLAALTASLAPGGDPDLHTWTDRLNDTAVLGRDLPLLGDAVAGQLDPHGRIQSILSGMAGSYSTLGELQTGLDALPGVTVSATRDLADNLELDLQIHDTASLTVPLSEVFGSVDLAIDSGASPELTIGATTDAALTVGAFWDGGQAVFYLAPGTDVFQVSTQVTASSLTAAARLGFVDIAIDDTAGNAATMQVDYDLDLLDPGDSGEGAGRVTLAELTGQPLGSLVGSTTPTAVSGPSLSLKVTSSLIPVPETITLDWPDVTDPANVTPALGSYEHLAAFSGATFTSGLTEFAAWTGALDNLSMLGRPLPIISDQLPDAVDLPGLLQNRLVAGVGSFNTAQSLITRLEAVSGISGVTASLVGNELRYSLDLNRSFSQPIKFELGLSDLPVKLDIPGFNLGATVSGTLQFGADVSTGTFFVADDGPGPELTIAAAVSAPAINASGGVGFLSVEVAGGSAQLTGNIEIDLDDTAGDHQLTSSDFAGGVGTLSSLLDYSITGTADVSLPISSATAGLPQKTFTANWPDLSDTTITTNNLGEMSAFSGFSKIGPTAYSFGLDQLAQYLATMAGDSLGGTNPFQKKLPLLNKSPAELVDFETFLDGALTQHTEVTYAGDGSAILPFETSADLLSLLQGLDGVGPGNASVAVTADDIRFTLHMDKLIESTVPIDLGIDSAIDLAVTGNITSSLDVDLDVTFGVDKADGRFFILESPTPVFSATGSVSTDIDLATRLGFLGVDITDGTAAMALNLAVNMVDPATDAPATPGKISSDELGSAPVGDLVNLSGSGTASVALPLSATLGAFSRSGTLTATWSDIIGDPTNFVLDTSAVADMLDFEAITPADVLQGLAAVPGLLGQLLGDGAFGRGLPFIGSSVGGLVDVAGQLQGYLDSLGAFTTAQGLKTALEAVLGGTVDVTVTAGDVRFGFGVTQNIVNQNVNFNIDEGVAGLGFQLHGTLKVNGTVHAGVLFGLSFTDGLPAEDRFYLVTGPESAAQASFRLTTPTPFSATATFGLLTVGIENSTATVAGTTGGAIDPSKDATLSLEFADPSGADGKITLGDLLADPGAIISGATLNVDGAAEVELHFTPLPATPPEDNPGITFGWSDIANVVPDTINPQDLDSYLADAANFDWNTVLSGIQSILGLIGQWTSVDLMNTKIPLLDVKLSDVFNFVSEASLFFNQLAGASPGTAEQFDTAASAALAAAGLPGDSTYSLTASSNPSQHNPTDLSNPRVRYLFEYERQFAGADIGFGFSGDLFTLDVPLQPQLSLKLLLEFGFSKADGFYLVDRGTAAGVINPGEGTGPEVTLGAGITMTDASALGTFGPLEIGVKDANGNVTFGVNLDLTDPSGSDGLISAAELAGDFLGVLDPGLSGSASLVMPLGLYLGEGGPGAKTTFKAYWDAAKPAEFHFGSPSGSTDPADGFSAVQFELGEFVRDMIGPVISKIKEFNPLPSDIIDVLTTPLPVIDKTPIDLLAGLTNAKGIGLLFDILNVVDDLNAVVNSGKDLDLSQYGLGNPPANAGQGSDTGGDSGPFAALLSTLDHYDISVPILQDVTGSVVKILMGQDVDLIRWNPDPFEAKKEFNIKFPIFSYGIPAIAEATINGMIGGGFRFFADLDIGLTTRGLRDPDGDGVLNLMDGFFIGDNIKDGEDPFETGFGARVSVGVSGSIRILGIDAVEVYGQGGVEGIIGLDLSDVKYDPNDPTIPIGRVGRLDSGGDNRVYLDEIAWLLANHGFPCTLTLGGELDAFLGIGIRALFGLIDEYAEVRFVIAKWELPCGALPPTDTANKVGSALEMTTDGSTGGKRVEVSIRRDRQKNPLAVRIMRSDNTTVDFEEFSLTDAGDPNYIGPGSGITSLVVEGTGGDDVIRVDPALTSLTDIQHITVNAHGGDDDIDFGLIDEATSNLLTTTVWAGPGDDLVVGTFADDTIYGEGGADQLTGEDGIDTIRGGADDDVISGGDGGDTLYGDSGADTLYGQQGANTLSGGSGDDRIFGGDDTDLIYGDEGADYITGADGVDTIYGGIGGDDISGGKGPDDIFAEQGDDKVDGGPGDDTIEGGSGNDTIEGGDGDNTVLGQEGDDTINTRDGRDHVEGGPGKDHITTRGSTDVIFGNEGDDTIYAGDANDLIFGGSGRDAIHGGNQDDYIEAGPDNDTVFGDKGFDLLVQTADTNQTLTNTSLTGQSIDVLASIERVKLTGGPGDNTFDVSGWTGAPVLIDGRSGTDRIVATRDTDFTISDWNLTLGSGESFSLTSIEQATLTGGAMDNTFRFEQWSHTATLDGAGGVDRIVSAEDGDFTLTDASLARPAGGLLTLAGIDEAEITGGPGANVIDASGFSGRAFLYGRDGADTLTGGAGDDLLDGGTGADALVGNGGDDELRGGGGAGDSLDGGPGDDILRGSDDGADVITGGPGRDTIRGNAGNDTISGGPGADTIDGGAGDDRIAGDGGGDILVGGADHDTIYGHNTGGLGDGTADDGAIDYLYGDFGTGGDEPGSGQDQLFGGGGNDLIFAEAMDDFIDPGAGVDDIVDYGSGDGGTPSDFVPPAATGDPALGPADPAIPPVAATLPEGVDYFGRWPELAGSATDDGTSGGSGRSIEPAVVAGGDGQYVAWSDNRTGNYEIYVARHTAGGWEELAGSAHGGGISDSASASHRPSITLGDDGQPIVAWSETNFFVFGNIKVARFDPAADGGAGAWVAMDGSPGPETITSTGNAIRPVVVNTVGGPVVAYLDSDPVVRNIRVKQFSGGVWSELGAGAATGDGISDSATGVSDLALATDGTKVAAAWTVDASGTDQIYLREYNGSSWNELSGSASGGGVSNTAGDSRGASLAYHGGALYAAWQTWVGGAWEIYAARHTGSWVAAGSGATTGGGVSSTGGAATGAKLASRGGRLYLAWTDDRVAALTGNTTAVYAKRWNGSKFVEELAGDATGRGIHPAFAVPSGLALAVGDGGEPLVAFSDIVSGTPQIYVRGGNAGAGTVYYVNDGATLGDVYTTAAGDDANAGTSPGAPKATIQSVVDDYDLEPGDVILVDAGTYASAVTIAAGDAGVTIQGAPDLPSDIGGTVMIDGADGVVLRQLRLGGLVAAINSSDDVALLHNVLDGAGISLNGGSDAQVLHNLFDSGITGVALPGAIISPTIEHNVIGVIGKGLSLTGDATGGTGLTFRYNTVSGGAKGVELAGPAAGVLTGNNISATGTALSIGPAFTGTLRISGNDIHDSATGVAYGAAALLTGNRIFDNTTGVSSTVGGDSDALGFVGSLPGNEIYGNTTGVSLAGRMQKQHVHDNATGASGSGVLGPDDLDMANLIEANTVGVDFDGTVQYNRIARNVTGIDARSGQEISHNLIYRNTGAGVHVSGATDVRIISNTMYAPAGDNVRLENGASEVEIRDNILWAESGYDVYVANDSQSGFYSDYNDLYAIGGGRLVYWTKDFADVLDWQADVARFDLHSIGRTAVNPNWAEPRFANKALDDYRIGDLAAGQRFSSPTIDAGDGLTDLAQPALYQNLLQNADFESGVTGWTTSLDAVTRSADPAPLVGGAYFDSAAIAEGFAEQTVDLAAAGFTPAELDSRDLAVTFGGRMRSREESPVDAGRIIVTFLDGADAPIGDPVIVPAKNTTDRWELAGDRLPLPFGTRSIRYRFEADRNSGTSDDAYLDHAFLYVLDDTVMPNQGAYGNTPGEAAGFTGPHIALRFPDLYADWERSRPRLVRWDSFGNDADSNVRIDLYQDGPDGPQWLLTMAATTADDGEFTWIPFSDSGVDYNTHGLRVQVSLLGSSTVFDRSTEPFSVPEDGNNYYVNVADDAGTDPAHDYTTAPGDNRNTGKRPDAPKPNPVNVLRVYELTSGATEWVDPGVYPLIDTISLSGLTDHGLGLDRGFTLIGPPPEATGAAELITAIPGNTGQTLIFMDDADLMQVANLTLTGGKYGLHAVSGSTGLVASNLVVRQSDQHGLFFDSGSGFDTLSDVTVSNVTHYDGVRVRGGSGGTINNLAAHHNRIGLNLTDNVTAVNIDNLEVYNNSVQGANLDGSGTTGTWQNVTAYQNTEGLELDGNIEIVGGEVHDNLGHGIEFNGTTTLTDVRAYNNAGTGISGGWWSNLTLSGGEVFGNARGVLIRGGEIHDSRIYGNTGEGILADQRPITLTGSAIYSNQDGLFGSAWAGGAFNVAGNLFYDHTGAAVRFTDDGPTATNVTGNTIYEPTADGIRTSGAHHDLTLRDNIIWTDSGYDLYISDDSQSGFDSQFNLLYATGDGKIGFWQGDRANLTAWRFATFQDAESLSADPMFVDPDGTDDILGAHGAGDGSEDNFHLQSLYGSYRPATGTFEADLNQSPAIDRGDPVRAFDQEPLPNGGYVNLGRYGDTPEASKSPAQYVLITNPVGGETVPQESNFPVRWRSDGFTGDVLIEYSSTGDGGPFATLSATETNDGLFLWHVDQAMFPLSDQYALRITSVDVPAVTAISGVFEVTEPISQYYVNIEGDVDFGDNEYTAAAGDDANDGLTPATPKASIRAILEQYDLEFGDTIFVDSGDYTLTANIIIDHEDSGATIQGPVLHKATLDRQNVSAGQYVFLLDDADAVTIRNLSITGGEQGIHLKNGSRWFRLENSTVYENAYAGLNITDAASTDAHVVGNIFYGNALDNSHDQNFGVRSSASTIEVRDNDAFHTGGRDEYGIYIDNAGTGVVVADNRVFSNSQWGLRVVAQQFVVSGNTAWDNGYGFYLRDSNAPDPSQSFDNLAFENTNWGFQLTGPGEHARNEAHDNSRGIFADSSFSGLVRDSVAFRNTDGFWLEGGTLRDSRAFGNSSSGIVITRGNIRIAGNTSYDNRWGLFSTAWYGDNVIENNLIYDNTEAGVVLQNVQSSGTLRVGSNTVVGAAADALRATGNSKNISLKDNIFSVTGSGIYALSVANSAQTGFASDYNLFDFTGGAKLALWQNEFDSLADWRYELGFDQHSITGGPSFVDPAGPDGVRGWEDVGGLHFEGFPNKDFTGPPTVEQIDSIVDVYAWGGYRGLPNDNQSFRWSGEVYLSEPGDYSFSAMAWGPQRLFVDDLVTPLIDDFAIPSNARQTATYNAASAGWVDLVFEVVDDGSQVDAELKWITPKTRPSELFLRRSDTRHASRDPMLVDGSDDDFHLASEQGSYHGGAWAADEATSPAIDAGDPSDVVAEDAPAGLPPGDPLALQDGDRVNLGAFGNTPEASRSPASLIQLFSPDGLEKLQVNQPDIIQWRTVGDFDFVRIELSTDAGGAWTTLSTMEPNDGNFGWTPAAVTTEGLVRVTAIDPVTLLPDPAVSDTSAMPFSIGADTDAYYVNDAFEDGVDQYATAAGDNANTGTTPGDPMASLGALLRAYDLEPGDTVYVDNGTYHLVTTLRIDAGDAGIRVVGPDPALGGVALFDRGNTAAGRYAFTLDAAAGVVLKWLDITGGERGVQVQNDSDNVTIDALHVYDNSEYGLVIGAGSDNATVRHSRFHGQAPDNLRDQRWGISVAGSDAVIYDNQAYHTGGRDSYGIVVNTTGGVTLYDNVVYENSDGGIVVNADGNMLVYGNVAHDNRDGLRLSADSSLYPGEVYGNEAYANSNYGMVLYGWTRALAKSGQTNELHDNVNGLFLTNSFRGTAGDFIIRDNSATGAYMEVGTLEDSRIFGNGGVGVRLNRGGTTLRGNAIYSNARGIHSTTWYGTNTYRNNLIYDNTDGGVLFQNVQSSGNTFFINNTVYEPGASAVQVTGNSKNVTLGNNVLWAGGADHYAVAVEDAAQTGFAGDYNLLHTTGGASLGLWQLPFTTLTEWQLELGLDTHSIFADPLLVDPPGADGVLGASGATRGEDDDLHLASTVASYHGGAWTADGADSPAIDAGDPADPVTEDAPAGLDPADPLASQDGDRVNLGAYGNTNQASRSQASFLQLLSFNGGDKVLAGDASVIRWRSTGLTPTVDIDFVDYSGGPGVVTPIASGVPDTGAAIWNPSVVTAKGKIRITGHPAGDPATTILDESDAFVVVGRATDTFYVNNALEPEDEYTTAAGDNFRSGTTPADPMASLNALLRAYDLGPGDTVLVDAGTYHLPTNTLVAAGDSGVRIVGVIDPAAGEDFDVLTVLDRGNVNAGRYTLHLASATDVEIRNLKLTGGEVGLKAVGADRLLLQNNIAVDNKAIGFDVSASPTIYDAVIRDNIASGTTGADATDQNTGFDLDGVRLVVEGNKAFKIGSQLGTGIHVESTGGSTVSGNVTYNNDTGLFARINDGGEVFGNTSHDNNRGFQLDDDNAADRMQVHDNVGIDNDEFGFFVEDNTQLYGNEATQNATGIQLNVGSSVVGPDRSQLQKPGVANVVFDNTTGITVTAGTVRYNRIFGNSNIGVLFTMWPGSAIGNVIYGNSVGISVDKWRPNIRFDLVSNVVYDNANQGIYVNNLGSGSTTRIINNTVWHDVGTAVWLKEGGANATLENNIVFIRGGLGLRIDGNTTNLTSDWNNVYPDPGTGAASFGQWKGAVAADLAAWQAASGGQDPNSLSEDPLFQDIDGADNLLGWEQPDPASAFADFGADDDFQLLSGSPMIDAADSEVAPDRDAAGRTRQDDPGTANTGGGVFRFYDLGALEFQGSSTDTTPPVVTDLGPVGMTDGVLTNVLASNLVATFSEPMNPVSTTSTDLYVLVEAGPDEAFDTADDVTVTVDEILYAFGDTDATIVPAAPLADGFYRLTLKSGLVGALTDVAGNMLDGDEDAVAGGDFVRTFRLDRVAPTVQSMTPSGYTNVAPAQFAVVFADNLFGGQIHLDAASVENAANYTLLSSLDETFGNGDDTDESSRIDSLSYDVPTRTVTVALTAPLPVGRYQLTLHSGGIADLAGNGLDGDGDGVGGDDFAETLVVDQASPLVTAVAENGQSGRSVSSIDPDAGGIQAAEVTFTEPVLFDAGDVTVQTVTFPGGEETIGATLTPTSVTGSGTSVMTITLEPAPALDTWIKVTLTGANTITDLAGNPIDGDAPAAGSGRGYLYDAALDLPSGDGSSGGNARFFLGSLRGDLNADRRVDDADLNLLLSSIGGPAGAADLNGDDLVNAGDLSVLLGNFGDALDALPLVLGSLSVAPDADASAGAAAALMEGIDGAPSVAAPPAGPLPGDLPRPVVFGPRRFSSPAHRLPLRRPLRPARLMTHRQSSASIAASQARRDAVFAGFDPGPLRTTRHRSLFFGEDSTVGVQTNHHSHHWDDAVDRALDGESIWLG